MRFRVFVFAVVIAVAGTASALSARRPHTPATVGVVAASPGAGPDDRRFERLTDPPRTVITTGRGAVVATLTDGARTAVLNGPVRSLRDPRSPEAVVTTTAWVRLAPQPWSAGAERAGWFGPWLAAVAGSTAPDVLAAGLEYVDGAPTVHDGRGARIAGDAAFGEHADYDDYLGDRRRSPAGAVDSAGFVRLVYGFREGFPLHGAGSALPRTARAMSARGPGVGIAVTGCSFLQPGDLVFSGRPKTPGPVTRVGIYLGRDGAGRHWTLASRRVTAGPGFGAVPCGDDPSAQPFAAARRL
ncbi:hypothetical protein [Amycolatopsis sp. NPDC003861]